MITRIRRWLGRLMQPEGFRGPVLTLLSGTVVALGLAYLAQPLLTRLYTPAAFGLMDFFISLVAVLMPFASMRYEDAIMLPDTEEDAAGVLWLSTLIMLAFVALTGLLVIWKEEIAALFGNPDVAPWLILVPAALLAVRVTKLGELWLTRLQRYRVLPTGQVLQTLTMIASRVTAGMPPLRAGTGGLIGGYVLGNTASALLYARYVRHHSSTVLRKAFDLPRLSRLATRYRRFPIFTMPSTLLSALVSNLPRLLLLYFFDATIVGLFGRTFASLGVPLTLIGGAVAQVFFVKAAEAYREGTLAALTQKIHARLVMISLFPTLALLIAGPDVFAFVFGETWRLAGVYVRYVGLWLCMTAIAYPLTRLFDVLERQRADLMVSLVMFVVQTGALVAGGLTGNVPRALLLLGTSGALVRILHVAVMLHLSGVEARAALWPYARFALMSLPFLILIAAATSFQKPWLTTLSVGLCGSGYAALIVWRERLLAS